MPLGEEPQGLLLDQITSMIAGSQRAVYEVGAENGNVWFELGFSASLRQPTALMSDRESQGARKHLAIALVTALQG